MEIIEELNITDLIEIDMLQRIQDAFSLMTGMATLTTDRNGIAITKGTRFSDFCMKYCRSTELGRHRCEKCDRLGAEKALRAGASCAYFCHEGLVDFAAPIMAGEQMVGCFIGGQVLTVKIEEEKVRRTASELGVDPDELVEAAGRVRIVDKPTIDRAVASIYSVAKVISEIAMSKHQIYLKNLELQKASKMKSDFLANMSHEIRTPMNAVIGMAEMALREELTPAARNYLGQIKTAGQSLLTIINDILDFSKIESGKLDISCEEYEPMSLVNDMVNIIMTRIGNKGIELTLDVNPDLPFELYGDSIRIKQVMINLANNAVKFTRTGNVHLKVDFQRTQEDTVELQVAISDTGSGIKEEDMDKLFKSFQQLDSKRNRNIEGTGLGLAISKQLVSLMHGRIWVDSVYGKGSTFSFSVPQRVVEDRPSIGRPEGKVVAAGLVESSYIAGEMEIDMPRMGVVYSRLGSEKELAGLVQMQAGWLFVEQPLYTDEVHSFLREHPEITGVVLVNFRAMRSYSLPNVRVVKKPLYSLSLAGVFHGEDTYAGFTQMQTDDFEFTAPEAEVLIVDDNAINLTVATGLLEPLNMRIETALSGKEAVEKITDKRYDIIFMDHMMPELDGVETTRIIRRLLGENGQVPIIALTANAMDGTKELFLSEGMNDFVAKPIELRVILSKLRAWLPEEKILRKKNRHREDERTEPSAAAEAGAGSEKRDTELAIEGLDVQEAMRLLGNEKLFWAVLKEYYRVIEKKYNLIRNYEQKEQWREYTTEVHALKSSSRQIGALELASLAECMEAAGNAGQAALIHKTTPALLDQYIRYQKLLAPYFEEKAVSESGGRADWTQLAEYFGELQEAMDNLDMDAMEEVVGRMGRHSYSGVQGEYFEKLKDAVDDIDTEACEKILRSWEELF